MLMIIVLVLMTISFLVLNSKWCITAVLAVLAPPSTQFIHPPTHSLTQSIHPFNPHTQSIHPSIHPIHPSNPAHSIHPPTQSIHPPTQPTNQSVNQSINQSTHPIHPSPNPSIYPSIHIIINLVSLFRPSFVSTNVSHLGSFVTAVLAVLEFDVNFLKKKNLLSNRRLKRKHLTILQAKRSHVSTLAVAVTLRAQVGKIMMASARSFRPTKDRNAQRSRKWTSRFM